jgi:hypothetical protein
VVTDISEKAVQNDNILIYPNPAKNEITIDSNQPLLQVSVYSITGKLMFQTGSVSENRKTIDLARFSPGIYLVRMVQGKNIITKKIMVDD